MTRSNAIARRTVARDVHFEGRGIHADQSARLNIKPATGTNGIVLCMAGKNWPPLPARAEFAVADESDRRTVLRGSDGQLFQQLEHIMAALAACGVTDAVLEQEGPEPPFLDGGSLQYMRGLLDAGFQILPEFMEPLVIHEPIHVADGAAEMVATPHDGLRLTCFVEFPGTVAGSMGTSLEINADSFLAQAAPARTFALERDIAMLKAAGLAKGGNLSNAVVFNETHYLNESLNFPDEVARHKIIDLLGDLALIGRPLRGHFWAWRAGHRSHVRFAQAIAAAYHHTEKAAQYA